ncbi:MAG TPA: hypothetical protein VG474_11540 [Solirubrobacteraceae bacterium]|nr:hypothetical protein [Solirubrobacteraceae bacterium]
MQIITLLALIVGPATTAHARSTDLWATVNVCDTASAPNTIGIRGSMPGARSRRNVRYMRFVVEYYSETDRLWQRVAEGGDSGWLRVGRGRRTRQYGRSLRIDPMGQDVLLRGLVYFQWRTDDGEVVRRARARTRRGHRSDAGADPPGYSASTCTIRA